MKCYVHPSLAGEGYYYIANHDASNPNAELCENGNIKIIIHTSDLYKTVITQEDLDLFYTKIDTIIPRYLPVTFNGRLL